ncbi:halocyanin domain-containing protein [Haladaptatus sp. NG-WS-4]
MLPNTKPTRRHVLKTTAAAASLSLAGCLGSDEGNDSDGKTTDDGSFGDWFENVPNYDGTVDETGKKEVRVTVGGDANNALSFEPAAIAVSTGTTVVWEWSGKGGVHNVVDTDGAFESKLTAESGFTFEHTFEETGTYRYFCEPHRSMGMKGGVQVE